MPVATRTSNMNPSRNKGTSTAKSANWQMPVGSADVQSRIKSLGGDDAAKYVVASEMAKDKFKDDPDVSNRIMRNAVDEIYNSFAEEGDRTPAELRNENDLIQAGHAIGDFVDDLNANIGSGLDATFDTIAGGVAGFLGGEDNANQVKDMFSAEDMAIVPDIAEDILLPLIPYVGKPLSVVKNLAQRTDEISEAASGVDAITQEKLSDLQRVGKGLEAALGVGLSAAPGVAMKTQPKATQRAIEAWGKANNIEVPKDLFENVSRKEASAAAKAAREQKRGDAAALRKQAAEEKAQEEAARQAEVMQNQREMDRFQRRMRKADERLELQERQKASTAAAVDRARTGRVQIPGTNLYARNTGPGVQKYLDTMESYFHQGEPAATAASAVANAAAAPERVAQEAVEQAAAQAAAPTFANAAESAAQRYASEVARAAAAKRSSAAKTAARRSRAIEAAQTTTPRPGERVTVFPGGEMRQAADEETLRIVEELERRSAARAAAKKAAETATGQAPQEAVEQAAKEAAAQATEGTSKEATEEAVKEAVEEAVKEATEGTAKETTEEAAKEAAKDGGEKTAEKAAEEAAEEATEEAAEEKTKRTLGEALDAVYNFPNRVHHAIFKKGDFSPDKRPSALESSVEAAGRPAFTSAQRALSNVLQGTAGTGLALADMGLGYMGATGADPLTAMGQVEQNLGDVNSLFAIPLMTLGGRTASRLARNLNPRYGKATSAYEQAIANNPEFEKRPLRKLAAMARTDFPYQAARAAAAGNLANSWGEPAEIENPRFDYESLMNALASVYAEDEEEQ